MFKFMSIIFSEFQVEEKIEKKFLYKREKVSNLNISKPAGEIKKNSLI